MKKILKLFCYLILLVILASHPTHAMNKTLEALITARERLITFDSLKVFGGVALGSMLFDYTQNLICSALQPSMYNIKKHNTIDQKLIKPLKESFKSMYIKSLLLGSIVLINGRLFTSSPLHFSDLIKPGTILISSITLASILNSFYCLLEQPTDSSKNDFQKDYFLPYAKTTSRACIGTTALMLPIVLILKD